MWRLEWIEILETFRGSTDIKIKEREYVADMTFKTKRQAKKFINKWKLDTVTECKLYKIDKHIKSNLVRKKWRFINKDSDK